MNKALIALCRLVSLRKAERSLYPQQSRPMTAPVTIITAYVSATE